MKTSMSRTELTALKPEVTDPGPIFRSENGDATVRLTLNGIVEDDPDYDRQQLNEWYEIVFETEDVLITKADQEFFKWCDERRLNISTGEWYEWMHSLAYFHYNKTDSSLIREPWGGFPPLVFSKEMFD